MREVQTERTLAKVVKIKATHIAHNENKCFCLSYMPLKLPCDTAHKHWYTLKKNKSLRQNLLKAVLKEYKPGTSKLAFLLKLCKAFIVGLL